MKNKTKLKLLLSLLLVATPCLAQESDADTKKHMARAREFADFVLRWTDWGAYYDIKARDKRRAERDTYQEASERIPLLVQDSTLYANAIVKNAGIINKRYPINRSPDMAFFLYELRDIYKYELYDTSSEEYLLGKIILDYEQVLKKLKLARYTMYINQK